MGRREEEARRLDATKRHEENVGRLREEKRLRDLEKQVGTACWKGHKANALRKKLFNEMDRNRDVSLLVYGTCTTLHAHRSLHALHRQPYAMCHYHGTRHVCSCGKCWLQTRLLSLIICLLLLPSLLFAPLVASYCTLFSLLTLAPSARRGS